MGVVTYFREVLFYDITIIPRSRFLGDNGKQSIPPDGKTIKRCIIHRSPYWGNTQILEDVFDFKGKFVNIFFITELYLSLSFTG